jgi:hypothetical protein
MRWLASAYIILSLASLGHQPTTTQKQGIEQKHEKSTASRLLKKGRISY